MKARLEKLRERIDGLTLRERAFVLAAGIFVVAGLWEALLAAPLDAREQTASTRIEALQDSIEKLDRAIETSARGMTEGMPGKAERIEALQERVAANDESLRLLTSDLVDPAQMRDVLEELVLARPGLALVRIENLPPEPMFGGGRSGGGKHEAASGPRLYRHSVVVELEGTYLEALDYVREVEGLRWQLYWPRLAVETQSYPRARIVVELSTLSLEAEWIGV